MQEVADSIWKNKRRYTPEVLKLRRMLRRMEAALELPTTSRLQPTRTKVLRKTTRVKKGIYQTNFGIKYF